jgi:hypothetical protein
MDMGLEPYCLLGVRNILEADDAIVSAHTDVFTLPTNLDNQVSGALTQVRNALEALNIPGNWVAANNTFREVTRMVCGLFQFLQQLNGVTSTRLFSSGITLATRFNQLPQAVRDSMILAATNLGINTSSLSGSTTLRIILKTLADYWISTPLRLYGEYI